MHETCRACKQPATTRCSRCAEAYYCSRTCQAGHWSEHKEVCKHIMDIEAMKDPGSGDDEESLVRVEQAIEAAAQIGGEAYGKVDQEMRARLSRFERQGADISAILLQQQLSAAASEGNLATILRLLQQGVSADPSFTLGVKPLHAACGAGQSAVARVLLEHGAQVDSRDRHGMTPLHLAVANGCGKAYVDTVLALGFAGARFDTIVGTPAGVYGLPPHIPSQSTTMDADGMGASSAASKIRDTDAAAAASAASEARERARAWASRDAQAGRTLLHLVAASDSNEDGAMTRAVIRGCAGLLHGRLDIYPHSGSSSAPCPVPFLPASLVDGLDPDGLTPLSYAAAHAHVGAVRALLDAGACPHGKLPAVHGAAVAADRAAAFDCPGADMPMTHLLEALATAIFEEEATQSAFDTETEEGEVKQELFFAAQRAQALQQRCLSAAAELLRAGAVVTSAADCDAADHDQLAWEEAGIDTELPSGVVLQLPRLTVACSNPSFAPFVALCLATGQARPRVLANDGKTTPLHVACLALNLLAAQSLCNAMYGDAGPTEADTAPLNLKPCIDAGVLWAKAHAAESSPGLAHSLVAKAVERAQELRQLLRC